MGRTTTLAAPALAAALAVTGVQAGYGSPRAHDMPPFHYPRPAPMPRGRKRTPSATRIAILP